MLAILWLLRGQMVVDPVAVEDLLLLHLLLLYHLLLRLLYCLLLWLLRCLLLWQLRDFLRHLKILGPRNFGSRYA